jgi:hypothetical protein
MGDIDLKLVDKRGEDFVPPAYTAFSGGGASLGYALVLWTNYHASLILSIYRPGLVHQLREQSPQQLRANSSLMSQHLQHVCKFVLQMAKG